MTPRTSAVVLLAVVASAGILVWTVSRPGPAAPRAPGASTPRIDPSGVGLEEASSAGEHGTAQGSGGAARAPRVDAAHDDAEPSARPAGGATAIDFLNVRIEEPAALLEEQREADLLRRELAEMGLVDEDAPGE